MIVYLMPLHKGGCAVLFSDLLSDVVNKGHWVGPFHAFCEL